MRAHLVGHFQAGFLLDHTRHFEGLQYYAEQHAQAPTNCETLTGSIRISECMRWNLLLKIPNDCSIFTLVLLKASLKASWCCVLGWG